MLGPNSSRVRGTGGRLPIAIIKRRDYHSRGRFMPLCLAVYLLAATTLQCEVTLLPRLSANALGFAQTAGYGFSLAQRAYGLAVGLGPLGTMNAVNKIVDTTDAAVKK